MIVVLDWVVLTAWLLSLATTIVNLRVLPRLRRDAPAGGPLVSILIPARNEEAAIERTVRAFLAQTHRALEVIVVDDRSTDATGAILSRIADPRLRVITGDEPPAGWLGKPWALHQGSLLARGQYLLFVDADIVYEPAAVAAAMRETSNFDGMLSILPHIEMRGFWENVAMPMLALTAFTFLPAWLSNRTRYAILAFGGGTGNLISRRDYDAVGGHEALRDAVVDDVALARLMRRSGRRSFLIRAEDLVSVRMYRGGGEVVAGFTKNVFAVFGRSYVSVLLFILLGAAFHVYPYAAAVTGNAIAIATVAAITVTRLILFVALRYNILAAAAAHPLMVLMWAWIALRSMWKTGVRRQLAWRGRVYDASGTRFGADR
ncbi:MAG TPA: glycosyltransferase family 2 protein [Thermoanaerobaculia bacterium]|nr:glycosyltransferase family 2 protein [Thermoanaerobaculia bacterium]